MFSFFIKVQGEEHCVPHEDLFQGFSFLCKAFDYRNNEIILFKIYYDGLLLYNNKKKTPLTIQPWEENIFFFIDSKFYSKTRIDADHPERMYFPLKSSEDWESCVKIIESNFFFELVDKNYTCNEHFLDINNNYLKKQIYTNICIWVDEVLKLGLWLVNSINVFDDERLVINYIEDKGFLNKSQYEKIFESYYQQYANVIHMKEILKTRLDTCNSLEDFGLIYMIGPARILESLISFDNSTSEIEKKAKYLSLIYENLVNEGKI